ncbi:polymorphic toxin-type HINT domain-containing protein [Streptomyces sp. TRM64462]|uniref:polymorphic toxin-type HINT domain-containing protein n=1 Tax=Streptomyces sp. TRM64462 TaxID=2741726 RepID=UPI0020C75EBE|nr:polymorphic toxin-type HINT domain-containing protein [Streptomyces sp. TRM64462]
MLRHRLPRRAVSATVLGLALTLTGSTVQSVAFADDKGRGRPGVQDFGDPVEGADAKAKPRPSDPARKAALSRLDKATWPKQGSADVPVSAPGAKKPAVATPGGLPITVTAPHTKAGVKPAAKSKTGPAAAPSTGKTAAAAPTKVKVDVLDPARAAKLGVSTLFSVERADGGDQSAKVRVNVDYSSFAEGYGGSYGSRLHLVQLPACAVYAQPGSKECPEAPKPLATVNDAEKQTLAADVTAAPHQSGPSTMATEATSLVAVTSGPSSAQGTYKATALSPSASWNVSPSSGGFSWSYPLRTVPTPGGQVPSLGLGYSSQSADGRTSATNNQGSWIGEGFSYDPGYIERRYKPCSDDGHNGSGEQCWAFDNATILLNGSATELVKDDTTGKWHLASDPASKVEKLTGAVNGDNDGEYWRVTTTDGTEYYFGLNRLPGWAAGNEETQSTWTVPVFGDDAGEPCYNATFTSAHCSQAWRWSLDYVKDPHGNVMSFYYQPETNHYALNGKTDVNGTPYHRGGYLKRMDYGQRDGEVYAAKAPARVVFTTAERCLPTATFDCAETKRTTANAAYWPDVPVDQECKAGTKCTVGQTFWTTKRLTGITTQMSKDATTYQDVDAWTFTHLFTDNGDDSKTLWLSKIDHEGRATGTPVKLPSLELFGEQLVNRVDAVGDNRAPFHRFRLATVLSETGAQLDINYAPTQCTADALPTPGSSTKRCYPVQWSPPGYIEPITDWFHKYVVAEIIETDRTGGGDSAVTRYSYQGDAAWRKAKPDGITQDKFLTWGGWQGYGKVTVTSGSADNQKTRVDYTYMQGMDGDKDASGGTRSVTVTDSTGKVYTDAEEFAGHQLEAATYDGTKLVAKTIGEPWKHYTATQTKAWATTHASIVRPRVVRGYTLLSNGTWRETKGTTTYDTSNGTGRVTQVEELGDVSTPSDDTCTRTWYADNPTKNILSLPSRSEAVAVNCGTTPDRRTQVLADERTSYDGGAFGAAPTKGDATKTERLTSHDGTTGIYQVTGTTTYDAFGRPLSQADASGATTTTAYTDAHGLISQTKFTNALGHVTKTDYAPAWGVSTGQTDPNGKRTDLAYDALGRLTSVWLPDRPKLASPSIKYSYNVRRDKVVAIKTEKIENDVSYGVEYKLFDSLLRPRQMQTEGPNGTRMVGDTFYDSTGNIKKTYATYNAAGVPSDELLIVQNGQVSGQNLFEYDSLGRQTAQIFAVSGVEQWRTTTRYDGERTHVDPPKGGVATTTITDALGRTTELRHYRGDAPNELLGYDATKYTYTPKGLLESVTDAQGNVWRYEYDQLGRKTKSIDPDAGVSTTTYDALDRPVSTTDGRGKQISTVYDKLGRTVSTWEGAPTTGMKLAETRYDKTGWLGHVWATLTYISATEYFASVVQSMDTFYQPLKTVYSVPASQGALAGTYIYTSTYNSDGTLQGSTVPAAGDLPEEGLLYGYDELQRPTSMSGYVTNAIYSNQSHLQQLELFTGSGKKVWQTYAYEQGTDRLTRSLVDVYGAPAPVKQSNYSYDQVGNVLSIADTANTATPDVQCFRYDTRQRLAAAWTPSSTLTDASGSGTVGSTAPVGGTGPAACASAPGANPLGGPAPYWKSYVTDAIGNRTSETLHDTSLDASKNITRTYTYGAAGTAGDGPHQLTKVIENTPTGDRQSTYEYDAAGNTTKRVIGGNAQVLEWNATGKLAKATEANGDQTTYLYDAGGNRIQRKDSTGTTVYLPGMELKLSADGTKTEATRYYTFAGQTVAVRTNDGKVSFIASDHHGTGEVAIDSTTGAVSQRRFDPYGVERGQATGMWPGEKGYVGGTIDKSTGLTHLGAREYDPVIGKFISVDPIIDYTQPQQINGYAYANNSPVTLSDPSGLYPCAPGLPDNQWCGSPPSCGMLCAPGTQTAEETAAAQQQTQAAAAVAGAQGQQTRAKQRIVKAAKVLIEIVKDELGINAAFDCVSSGDMGACGETILNIAGSFAGGIAGKLLAKYGLPWNWKKGYELGKRVVGLVDDLIGGALDYFKAGKALDAAKSALAKAQDKLAAARKKAAEARRNAGDGCHSFLPGTLVLLADGTTKPIEEVELGDRITVTDPETGDTVVREVVGTIVTEDDKHFVDLTIEDAAGKPQALISTTTHPFWVESENRWVEAGQLQPGMMLRTADDRLVSVNDVRRFDERQRTHDLTIADIHTYYVLAGDTPVLVHNCGGANGGKYGDLQPAGAGKEINHIPANSSSPLSKYSGPSIRMDYADHRAVYSTGSSLASQAWRMRQRELIDAGDFRGAIQMDVDDIRARFGSKYDEAITEMWMSLSSNKALKKWASERNP